MENLPAPFQPTIGLVIWTWVVFILLFLVLRKYIFPPLVQMTADREAAIKAQMADAERMRAESAAALEAHLAREFRALAGCSPSQWIAEEFRNVQAGPPGMGEGSQA